MLLIHIENNYFIFLNLFQHRTKPENMNILQSAIRRILVRYTDRAIMSGVHSINEAATESNNYNVSMPSIGTAILKIIGMFLLSFFVLSIFYVLLGKGTWLVFLIVIPYLISKFKRNGRYGVKMEAVYKTDRRYTAGRKIVGYKKVKDPDNFIKFNSQHQKINRIEAIFYTVILGINTTVVSIVPFIK